MINEENYKPGKTKRRIAVLNGIVDQKKLPFCGILAEGTPRLVKALPDEVTINEEAEIGPAELAHVFLSGERAVIPNVDFLQQSVLAQTV